LLIISVIAGGLKRPQMPIMPRMPPVRTVELLPPAKSRNLAFNRDPLGERVE
jgi:hypothetical protein